MSDYLPHLAALIGVLDIVLVVTIIPIVLIKKRDPTVAVGWCLVVLLMPVVGVLLFWMFGYSYVHRRMTRKSRHRNAFRQAHPPSRMAATRGVNSAEEQLHPLARIASAVDAFPLTEGNAVAFFHDTEMACKDLLEHIGRARHHVHLEFYIFRDDAIGQQVARVLMERARAGVEVRLLYDAVGSFFLTNRLLGELMKAGCRTEAFLPVNPLRSWIQVNLRNHRKLVVIDGEVGYTGGMNIGDEYLGRSDEFGYWRDTFLRVEGQAVAGLQRIFVEDWNFALGQTLVGENYFPTTGVRGDHMVQVIESGPDQETNSIREIYFAAILSAQKRVWIASPYFVPDGGLIDAMRLARLRGVDVRLLCVSKPDHLLSFYAGRYYWSDLLHFGGNVWQYQKGMMHAKVLIVDENWAMVGSANLDNRSLHLNFEACCLFYDSVLVADLAEQFLRDLEVSLRLDPWAFERRPLLVRLLENASRLFSPIL